jgi:hypothetical protein
VESCEKAWEASAFNYRVALVSGHSTDSMAPISLSAFVSFHHLSFANAVGKYPSSIDPAPLSYLTPHTSYLTPHAVRYETQSPTQFSAMMSTCHRHRSVHMISHFVPGQLSAAGSSSHRAKLLQDRYNLIRMCSQKNSKNHQVGFPFGPEGVDVTLLKLHHMEEEHCKRRTPILPSYSSRLLYY